MANIVVQDISVIAAFENIPQWQPLMNTLDKIGGTWQPYKGKWISPRVTRYDLFSIEAMIALLDTGQGIGLEVGPGIEVIQYPALLALSDLQLDVSVPLYVPQHPNKGVNDTWRDYGAEFTVFDDQFELTPCNVIETSNEKDHWPGSVIRSLSREGQTYVLKGMYDWPKVDDVE